MARQNWWTNSDGLYVGFGTRTVNANDGAKVSRGGVEQQVVVKITATKLTDTATADELANSVTLPAGAELTSAKLIVNTAFTTSASGTLDIGLYKVGSDGTDDDDGIDAAVAAGALGSEAVVTCDGALIGTILDAPYKIAATYDTGVWTAGVGTLVVTYTVPAN